MKKEIEQYLFDNYPSIYKDEIKKDGIRCDSGWFDIINDLSKKIIEVADKQDKVFEVVCVKEKFGGLRFYVKEPGVGIYPPSIYDFIVEAEEQSLQTCESCGSKEKVAARTTANWGWIRTLCNDCQDMIFLTAEIDRIHKLLNNIGAYKLSKRQVSRKVERITNELKQLSKDVRSKYFVKKINKRVMKKQTSMKLENIANKLKQLSKDIK